MTLKLKVLEDRRIWPTWILVCVAAFMAQLQTLYFDPLVLQDEVQILDYGRVFLDQSTDWALTWYVPGSLPVLPLNYLGVVVQEWASSLSGVSPLSPRIVTVLGAFIAASALLAWLLSRRAPHWVAFTLAAAFLLDPIFSDLYRGGRIDGWAIAACLASCLSIRKAAGVGRQSSNWQYEYFFAGALAVLSVFIWPTALMLFPLIAVEFIDSLRARAGQMEASDWRRAILSPSSGALAALLLLVLPVLLNFEAYRLSVQTAVELQAFASVIQHSILGIFLVYDPVILVLAVFAVMIHRDWGMLLALALALLMAYQTAIYHARIIYLLPYFTVLIGAAGMQLSQPGTWLMKRAKVVFSVLLVCLLFYNGAQVLVIRNLDAVHKQPANDPSQFLPMLEQSIGRGPYRVLLMEWQLYYAGRQLGWHMFQSSNPIGGDEYVQFIRSMDYVILREKPRTNATLGKLETAGFKLIDTLYPAKPEGEFSLSFLSTAHYPQSYPVLKVYKKAEEP